MLSKFIVLLFVMLPLTHICAQHASFQDFLSEFKKVQSIDSTSFGKPYDFIEHEERYFRFLPLVNEECCCGQENIRWLKGCYMECKNFVVVMLQRYCSDCQDGNSQWFMENEGMDYMLITYSKSGEMIDYKRVGHLGTAAYKLHITATEYGLGLVVEQKVLDDCSQLVQYENLVYTVSTHEYIFKSYGKIIERSIGSPHKEVVDIMSSAKQFSFEQFMSYFKEWDKPYIDHTIFTYSSHCAEIPFESCLSLIPDTLDRNCWPRDIQWIPCRYIANENSVFFFIIKDCMTPKIGYSPYTDYLVLEFDKNGTFKGVKNIYHISDDDSTVSQEIRQSLMTKTLKVFYKEKILDRFV